MVLKVDFFESWHFKQFDKYFCQIREVKASKKEVIIITFGGWGSARVIYHIFLSKNDF